MFWHCGSMKLDLSRPLIMGIVNATPDSFSDGGAHHGKDAAIAHAWRLIDEGADILDIGGESTRPGAAPVSVVEEIRRVVPVIEALRDCGKAISVDTSKPEVMIAAIQAGAHIVNDVRALTMPGALEVVTQSDVGVCVMHMQGEPQTMQDAPCYEDVLQEVEDYLLDRARYCELLGIARERICLDYGFGFGKTVEQNFALLANTDRFVRSGYPIMVGLSRKSSLGVVTGRGVNDRMIASVSGALLAMQAGAQIIRVHDVAQTVDALKIWLMTKQQRI
ncbi:MAG: dihydropteroate synthase [Burkholderiaceae bacterium]|nr:dihydropteroate synthase [Burkholderiaceae bacterium]